MTEPEGVTFDEARAMIDARHVTAPPTDERNRYVLYRMCECEECGGAGKLGSDIRCVRCRGEGRTQQEIATAGTPEALGVAIVTLAREGEWEGCPIGIRDDLGETGQRWLVRPYMPSAREVSQAARVLAKSKTKEKP